MNFLETSYKDVNWLKDKELNKETALEYFSYSPFYDRTCNNELLKMQSIDTTLKTGIEYRMLPVDNIIIEKFDRQTDKTLELFYILEGTIFMAPDIYSLISSRITAAAYHLKEIPLNKPDEEEERKEKISSIDRLFASILHDK